MRPFRLQIKLPKPSIFLGLLLLCQSVWAQEESEDGWVLSEWSVHFSIYTKHFDPEPDHNNDQNLVGIEALFENDWFVGAAVFDNSYNQDSQFLFVGKVWPIARSPFWYFKLRAGLLHGYKEPYQDKIPLNGLGIAPAIIPAVGINYRRVFLEANFAGTAAVTIHAGFRF